MGHGLKDGQPTVLSLEGAPQPREAEVARERAQRDEALWQRSAELTRSEAEVERLRRLPRELGHDEGVGV